MFNIQNVISSGVINNLPFHVYGKDACGKYIYVNNLQAKNKGFAKPSGMLGITDTELDPREVSDTIVKNDTYVKTEKAPRFFLEIGIIEQCHKRAISYKLPLLSRHNRVVGVIGASVFLDENNGFFNAMRALLFSSGESSIGGFESSYRLSPRQLDCLFHLVRGKTDKEMAKDLGISHRTVETHINEIKNKMHCMTRSQVMEKFFNENMLSLLPMLLR